MGANYEQQWVESVDRRLAQNATAIEGVGKKVDDLTFELQARRNEFQRDGKAMAEAMGVPVLTPDQREALNVVIAAELAKEIVNAGRRRAGIVARYWWAFLLGGVAGADQAFQLVHGLLKG